MEKPGSVLEKLRALEQQDRQRVAKPHAKSRNSLAILGAILLFLLFKGKTIFLFIFGYLKFLLPATKLLAFPKFFLTFSTMALSALFYAQLYGWYFGVGLVLLILVHELGHGAAARMLGLPVGAPIFIPFVGAFIALKKIPRTPWINAVIGAGGPLFGLLGALTVCCLIPYASQSIADFLRVLAYFTLLLNLFNLMPVFGLDGDRISDPMNAWQCYLVVAILLTLVGYLASTSNWHDPTLLIIALLLFIKGVRRHYAPYRRKRVLDVIHHQAMSAEPERVSTLERWGACALYTGLALSLALSAYMLRLPERI
jgi:Zn-dependent protease